MKRVVLRDFLLPLLLLVFLTLLIALTDSDQRLMQFFYRSGTGWQYANEAPWCQLYRYGVLPGYLVALSALVLLSAGYFSARAYLYRKCALFLVLFLLLGPGFVVNTVFKDHWGRPRPKQVQAFGGDRVFHQVWERGQAGLGRSFPSGHASMAFFVGAPFFLLRRSSPRRARAALIVGACYGLLMGVARMVQGGHFLSDIVWAAGCDYLVGMALYHLLRLDERILMEPATLKRDNVLGIEVRTSAGFNFEGG